MSSHKIECPKCHREYDVTEQFLGRKVICSNKACGAKFLAEAFEPLEIVEESDLAEIEQPSSDGGLLDFATRPPLSKAPVSSRLKYKRATFGTAALLLISGVAIGFVGVAIGFLVVNFSSEASNRTKGDTIADANLTERDREKKKISELLYRTDALLRLLKVSNDANLARGYIQKWVDLRGQIKQSDETDVSLGVIEGHLKEIHEKIYPRTADRFGLDRDLGWFKVLESVEAIRTAQTQLMKLFKIRWDDAQNSDYYPKAFAALRDEGRRIASMSDVGKNNLPLRLPQDEASKLIRDIEILYAHVPVDTRRPSSLDKAGEMYEVPRKIDPLRDDGAAEWIRYIATSVIEQRTTVPVSLDTLQEKTEALKFSEQYSKDLEYLKKAVH